MQLIGIDCATDPRNMGFALGQYRGNTVELECVLTGTSHPQNLQQVARWLERESDTLLCLDAPLGWPGPLAESLPGHQAGQGIPASANDLFRREADREVKRRLNKQPLDVGADRIARTAWAALDFLTQLRKLSGLALPLAWSAHPPPPGASVIEVYPAATLVAHGLRASGYKQAGDYAWRREIIHGLGKLLGLPGERQAMETDADALDATICMLAGVDFLQGHCPPPTDMALARQEGWIWVREPRTPAC